MRIVVSRLASCLFLVLPLLASAVAEETPAKPAAPAVAAAAPEAPPAPPKELDQLDVFEGTWKCEGHSPESPFGPARKMTTVVKIYSDLDGFWLSGEVEEQPSADNPKPLKGKFHWTYDTTDKRFEAGWIDNMGGWATQSSPGWQGERITFDGEMVANGQKLPARDVFEKKADKELLHSFEAQVGEKWTKLGEEVCRRTKSE